MWVEILKLLYKKIVKFIFFLVTDRSDQPDCATGTPGSPTTTQPTTTLPPAVTDISASGYKSVYVCRGNTTTIQIPYNYQLFPINVFYGVAPNGQCSSIR